MSIEYRAEDEPPSSRQDYWEHVISEAMYPMEGCPAAGPDFAGRMLTGSIGAVRVIEVAAPDAECRRTPKLIRQADRGLYQLDVLAAGDVVVEHDCRQARLKPGDFTFVDPSRPCRWVSAGARHVAVMFPRALLPLREDEVTRLTGVRVPGDRGAGALLSALARQLPQHLDDYDPGEAVRLGAAVVDLLTVVLATRLGRGSVAAPDTRQRALLKRVHVFIEQRLADPGLTPATVADAHHISLRYLHKLFESQGTTVAGWIRRRRLDRCRRDLLDPALHARPVSAIGARWGFPDASRFSRAFRAEHGMPPGEYRLMGHGTSAN